MKNFFLNSFYTFYSDKTISLDIVIFSTLIILMPILLITGPALPDISLSLVACYFLIKSLIYKKWHYYKNPIVIGFLLFSTYGIFRSLLYEVPWQSLSNEGSIFYFRYIFFAMGVWYLLDNNPHLPRCLLIISLSCLFIVCIDGIYQYFNASNLFGNEKFNSSRLTGLFGNEPIIGRYVAYLSIIIFALLYRSDLRIKIIMPLTVFVLVTAETTVFLSGERAALFHLSFFIILIIIFIPGYRIYRILGVLVSAIIIYGIIEINSTAKQRIINHTLKQISQTQIPFLPYSSHHEEHYISALKMFLDKPIFGIGTNTFEFQCNKDNYKYKKRSCSSHPHNYYLQTLAELGIIGFLGLTLFFVYLCFIVLRQLLLFFQTNKQKIIEFELFVFPLILFVYWWPVIPHMSLYNNWNNVFMMLALGFFMKYYFNSKSNKIS